jgi:hypothetical protein
VKKASPVAEGKITSPGGRGRIDTIHAVKQPGFLHEHDIPTCRVARVASPRVAVKGDKRKRGRGGARLRGGRARPFPRETEKVGKGKKNRMDGAADKKEGHSRSGRQQTSGTAYKRARGREGQREKHTRLARDAT